MLFNQTVEALPTALQHLARPVRSGAGAMHVDDPEVVAGEWTGAGLLEGELGLQQHTTSEVR